MKRELCLVKPSPIINNELIEALMPILKTVRTYHRHQVIGMENIPDQGRCLLAVNHSLATYDIALLFGTVYLEKGRLVRSIADHLFFKIPGVGDVVNSLGAVEGTHANALKLLEEGELVGVAPGGMREALRPSSERYQILWDKRVGFAKLAIETQTPVVLAVCPKADDLYDVYPNRLTAWAYKKFKVPLFFARGLGLSPIPRPVKLIHFLSEPIYPPPMPKSKPAFEKKVKAYHSELVSNAQDLIGKAIAHRP